MFSVAILLAANTVHKHHIDWTAVTAVTALCSSISAILVAVLIPFVGYTRSRLEIVTDRLEKLYQAVKEEAKAATETMIHYRSLRLEEKDGPELPKSAEDFRKFIKGTTEIDVLAALYFTKLLAPIAACHNAREHFVNCWFDIYNSEPTIPANERFQRLLKSQRQVTEEYIIFEEVLKIESLALSSKQTATGLINVTMGELLKGMGELLKRFRRPKKTGQSGP
jgi:hypothetical protein